MQPETVDFKRLSTPGPSRGQRRRMYDPDEIEARWQAKWQQFGCHRAETQPTREKCFVHDSTPFPNGPLHLGHVRCYVLGDVTARFERLRGKSVLYHSGFDSFGLPIELEAHTRGCSPRQLVEESKRKQTSQLDRLGISYDKSHSADTSEPAVYRWTQWLFLGGGGRCCAPGWSNTARRR